MAILIQLFYKKGDGEIMKFTLKGIINIALMYREVLRTNKQKRRAIHMENFAVNQPSKYNISRCYCEIVLCWYVDWFVCRLRNYAKK